MFELESTQKRARNTRLFVTLLLVVIVTALGSWYLNEKFDFAANIFGPTKPGTVTLDTTKGDIVIQLYFEEAPELAENFFCLARLGRYNDTIFHRVIEGFIIQGGDYENADGTGGEGCKRPYLPDEFSEKLSHTRGTVSMANKGPDTNASQFFIVHQDATFLDGRHSIIGKVIEGMDIVDRIAEVEVDENDRPLREVTVKRALPQR